MLVMSPLCWWRRGTCGCVSCVDGWSHKIISVYLLIINWTLGEIIMHNEYQASLHISREISCLLYSAVVTHVFS